MYVNIAMCIPIFRSKCQLLAICGATNALQLPVCIVLGEYLRVYLISFHLDAFCIGYNRLSFNRDKYIYVSIVKE